MKSHLSHSTIISLGRYTSNPREQPGFNQIKLKNKQYNESMSQPWRDRPNNYLLFPANQ